MNRTRTNVWRSFWIWSGFVIALTLASGIQHDYRAYLRQWLLVTSDNPWSIGNAYGPVHNLFALLLPIGRLAPELDGRARASCRGPVAAKAATTRALSFVAATRPCNQPGLRSRNRHAGVLVN
jgi:hypothetical protein